MLLLIVGASGRAEPKLPDDDRKALGLFGQAEKLCAQQPKRAEALAREALSIRGLRSATSGRGHLILGKILEQLGRKEAAIDAYRFAAEPLGPAPEDRQAAQARLRALGAALAVDPALPLMCAGPYDRLDAVCVRDDKPCPSLSAGHRQVELAQPARPFLAARLVASEDACMLALRTERGWWVDTELDEIDCSDPRMVVRKAEIVVRGGRLRLNCHAVFHGRHGDGKLAQSVLCGVGSSGEPSCTAPFSERENPAPRFR
jgi:hypothetical protein